MGIRKKKKSGCGGMPLYLRQTLHYLQQVRDERNYARVVMELRQGTEDDQALQTKVLQCGRRCGQAQENLQTRSPNETPFSH